MKTLPRLRRIPVLMTIITMGALCTHCIGTEELPKPGDSKRIEVFHDNIVHFAPEDSLRYETASVWPGDNGRMIYTTIEAPSFGVPVRITAHVVTRPIPKDIENVYDKWDRAGNVCLVREGAPDVEIVKFITAYGGVTEHEVDVSHLAPLLRGNCTIRGFIDTWVSPGWEMDFYLEFTPDQKTQNPAWVMPVWYEQSYNAKEHGSGGIENAVKIPADVDRVSLRFLVSGHCTDGRGADEFESKDNVIDVDDQEIIRVRPWRDDCRQFRAVNPYCRRWSDGSWSSDYSRSGWCPGDVVTPIKIDLSEQLTEGEHTLRLRIENVRPTDENGHLGYWRVSAVLLGWK